MKSVRSPRLQMPSRRAMNIQHDRASPARRDIRAELPGAVFPRQRRIESEVPGNIQTPQDGRLPAAGSAGQKNG
jgi:hypothetical protein